MCDVPAYTPHTKIGARIAAGSPNLRCDIRFPVCRTNLMCNPAIAGLHKPVK